MQRLHVDAGVLGEGGPYLHHVTLHTSGDYLAVRGQLDQVEGWALKREHMEREREERGRERGEREEREREEREREEREREEM